MLKNRKIGLFGGTFDPIHWGHLKTANFALKKLNLEKIFFIPNLNHALKPNDKISSAKIRYKLLELALIEFSDFVVCDIEFQNNQTSYTVDTISKFPKFVKIENAELYYLVGSDILNELHLWKDFDTIFKLSKLVILKREKSYNNKLVSEYKNRIIFLDSPVIEISSTQIRQNIKEGKPWKSMVPDKVYDYIRTNNLYQ